MKPQSEAADNATTRLAQDLGLSKLNMRVVEEANTGTLTLVGSISLGDYKEGDALLNLIRNTFLSLRDDILSSNIVQDHVEDKLEDINPFDLEVGG